MTNPATLPPFLMRCSDGSIVTVRPVIKFESVLKAVQSLDRAQQLAFGREASELLCPMDSYEDTESIEHLEVTHAGLAEFLLTCLNQPERLVEPYLKAAGLWDEVDWSFELRRKDAP